MSKGGSENMIVGFAQREKPPEKTDKGRQNVTWRVLGKAKSGKER